MMCFANCPDVIPGKRFAPAHLGRVLVVGLGKSGMAAVRYCAALLGGRVASLTVSAGKRTAAAEAFVEAFAGTDIEFRFEYEEFDREFDLCIVSPGVPEVSALYQNARRASAELISELEFAWRESDATSVWVGISGTNGKTTTTSLVEHLCVTAGMRARAVGNIGEVALTCVAHEPQDVYVAELSSFQLASSVRFAPEVAVLLNITPDHLAWHGSMERYIAAKRQLLAHVDAGACAVLDCTNDVVASIADELAPQVAGRLVRVVGAEAFAAGVGTAGADVCNLAGVRDGHLDVCFDTCVDCGSIADLQIKGEHNVINALAAAAAALALGISPKHIRAGLHTFAPLEHRIEPCGVSAGVSFFNDSKATNVDATCKAFTAFAPGSVICLLGGHDKGTDLTPLVDAARKTCRAVVCYGEAKERFLAAFTEAAAGDANGANGANGAGSDDAACTILSAPGMREAARLAASIARPGDAVLLSPACSSFDEFTCFEQRGEIYKALVRAEFCCGE